MFEQLAAVENRFEQISVELTRPEVISDNEQFTKLIKEHSELNPIVEKYREYTSAEKALAEAEEIISSAPKKNFSRSTIAPPRTNSTAGVP